MTSSDAEWLSKATRGLSVIAALLVDDDGRGRSGSRSAASMMLDIPRTTSLGDRAFAVAGPRFWNSLPPACHP